MTVEFVTSQSSKHYAEGVDCCASTNWLRFWTNCDAGIVPSRNSTSSAVVHLPKITHSFQRQLNPSSIARTSGNVSRRRAMAWTFYCHKTDPTHLYPPLHPNPPPSHQRNACNVLVGILWHAFLNRTNCPEWLSCVPCPLNWREAKNNPCHVASIKSCNMIRRDVISWLEIFLSRHLCHVVAHTSCNELKEV
jgi:hypothetical protein